MGTADIAGRLLHWKKARITERRCLLRPHDAEIVDLTPRSAADSLATGGSAAGGWTLRRVGSSSTCVAVGATGSDTDLAVYIPNSWSGGGTLAFRDGRTIRITTNPRRTSRDRVAG